MPETTSMPVVFVGDQVVLPGMVVPITLDAVPAEVLDALEVKPMTDVADIVTQAPAAVETASAAA